MTREIDGAQTGETGTYSPGVETFSVTTGEVTVRSLPELVKSGIFINPDIVAQKWGQPAAEAYREVVAARVRREGSIRNAQAPQDTRVGRQRFI